MVNGTGLKDQLISMARVEYEVSGRGIDNAVENTVKVNYSDIRAYRDIEIEKIPIEYRADHRLVTEMNYKGKKKAELTQQDGKEVLRNTLMNY